MGQKVFISLIHICTKRDGRWQQLPAHCLIATQYPKPEGLPLHRWVQNVSPDWYKNGEELAEAIIAGLTRPDGPQYVMIDETKATTAKKIAHAARILRTTSPRLAGRWGAYLVNGKSVSYGAGAMKDACLELLRAHAIVAPEFYLKESWYMSDHQMRRYMRGTLFHKRAGWLVSTRKKLNSRSKIVALMGITPAFLDGPKGTDHKMFCYRVVNNWRHLTGASSMGAWKWYTGTVANPNWDFWEKK